MRGQWGLITGIIVALLISIFAVINVDPVEVNYLVGQSDWPLVLVIIGSVLMGGMIVGGVGIYKIYSLQKQIRKLEQENASLQPDPAKRSRVKERSGRSSAEETPEPEVTNKKQ
ncbi:hypothetical protein CR205_09585 [Alteribacter lacisalsi]|uniref:Lipopolysaccharide assembly protein A domain-containing protein n=1 Tax=Alteribacter lacisalsi TaxID=2045244 RepID=A0A2W0HNZ3_9BACI|nr:lipopolysaccharide assembly protein LapA domain-containing protein [Alteribacter lacisalsi]PYZ98802.1 hypothetical protein CR205_09585 [Alteribacter lacisalsi]